MAKTLFGEKPKQTSAQILAVKSFYDQENSATLLNALSEEGTMLNLSKRKFDLRVSLELFNQPLLDSSTLQESGNAIVRKNDFWESLLRE